jgi:hypothetical protein
VKGSRCLPTPVSSGMDAVGMLEVLKSGLVESDDELMELTERCRQVVIPNENDDLDLTHWSSETTMKRCFTLARPRRFTTYIKERNGVQ